MNTNSRLVYSSESGNIRCPRCGKKSTRCRCTSLDDTKDFSEYQGGPTKVRREVQGRRGKPVITIQNLPVSEAELKALAGELKRKCGTGGSCKGGVIEIQGDHREVVLEELKKRGYEAKWSGG
jgi:translation initiation factor 1